MRKRLGQHFLIDGEIAEEEVGYAQIGPDDTVLEVGPGRGVLTALLLHQANRVVAIEKDDLLWGMLNERFKDLIPNRLKLIRGDVLNVEIPHFDRVVSNIPYGISTPVTFKLLKSGFKKGIIMYQWEYARRIVATVGSRDYSRLSVGVYFYANASILRRVPSNAFRPMPKVDSAMVELIPRKPPFDVDEEKFFWLTTKLFQHRRKKLRNILDVGLDNEIGERRGENLSPEEIAALANSLGENEDDIPTQKS